MHDINIWVVDNSGGIIHSTHAIYRITEASSPDFFVHSQKTTNSPSNVANNSFQRIHRQHDILTNHRGHHEVFILNLPLLAIL